jgi:ABC-type uncharacterized transport system involved in gliding motility auxiliary subunit
METVLRFSGYLGVVLLAFGIGGGLLTGSFRDQPIIQLHFVLGVLCLIAWVATGGIKQFSDAKRAVAGRRARYGFNVVAYTVVAVGLLVVANVFAWLNDKRWDLTEEGVYSLSPKTVSLVAGLKKPLKLVALDNPPPATMMGEGPESWRERVKTLLELYRYHNNQKVTVEFLDPKSRPVEVDSLGFKTGNQLYLEYGEGASKQINRINAIDEQSVTNAVIKLTRGESKKVYYIQGHGEPQLDSAGEGGMKEFVGALGDESIKIEGLMLAQTGSVPTDAAAVIVAAGRREIPTQEQEALTTYADNGGRLILLANIEYREAESIKEIAKHFGIDVGTDVILDEQLRLLAGPQIGVQFFARGFGAHPISSNLAQSDPPLFTFASSVVAPKGSDSGATYTELVKSGPSSWAEKNIEGIFGSDQPTAARDSSDLAGPVSIAVAYEKNLQSGAAGATDDSFEKVARVVVFGDATWLQNGNLAVYGNRDLFLNSVNWVLGEEGGVAIGPRSMRASVAMFPAADFNMILALSFVGPELILLFGLYVWWKRKVALA